MSAQTGGYGGDWLADRENGAVLTDENGAVLACPTRRSGGRARRATAGRRRSPESTGGDAPGRCGRRGSVRHQPGERGHIGGQYTPSG